MKNLFQGIIKKFGSKVFWAILFGAITAHFKKDELTDHQEQGLDTLKRTGDEVVKVLTDNNPNDKEQLIAVYEAHKHEIAEAALDLMEDEIKCKFAQHPEKLFVGQVAVQALRDLLNLPEDEIADAPNPVLPIIGEVASPTQEATETAPTYFDKNSIA